MRFEAECLGVKYTINVNELKEAWKIDFTTEDNKTEAYEIAKTDYRYLDNIISFLFKDSSYLIDVVGSDTDFNVYSRGTWRTIKIFNDETLLHQALKSGGMGGGDSVTSGMPGKIVKIMVEPGQVVKAEQPLLIMEAMKMENEIRATSDTKIKTVHVKPGDNVESGALLISFEPPK